MTDSISPNRVEEILKSLDSGKIDCSKVTLEEFVQVSFLQLMFGTDETHLNQKLMYGGNLFNIHVCVAQINPAEKVDSLREKQ